MTWSHSIRLASRSARRALVFGMLLIAITTPIASSAAFAQFRLREPDSKESSDTKKSPSSLPKLTAPIVRKREPQKKAKDTAKPSLSEKSPSEKSSDSRDVMREDGEYDLIGNETSTDSDADIQNVDG